MTEKVKVEFYFCSDYMASAKAGVKPDKTVGDFMFPEPPFVGQVFYWERNEFTVHNIVSHKDGSKTVAAVANAQQFEGPKE